MAHLDFEFSDRRAAWFETETLRVHEHRRAGFDGVNVFHRKNCTERWFSLMDLGCVEAPIERAFLIAIARFQEERIAA